MKFKTFDITKRSKLEPSRAIEREFQRALKKIARASSDIVTSHVNGAELMNAKMMQRTLKAYSKALTPWAKKQSKTLLAETIKRLKSDKAYQEQARKMGKLLNKELFETENGALVMALQEEQVALIQDIPLEAGRRAQELVLQGMSGSRRVSEIAKELQDTLKVTESRAVLIARTETARASTALNLARATSVGSTQYKWITSGDSDVRPSHRKMNGKVFNWDDPPTLEDGMTGHPGTFPNCRCYAEPILPNE